MVNTYDAQQDITGVGTRVVGQEIARSGRTTNLQTGTVTLLHVTAELRDGNRSRTRPRGGHGLVVTAADEVEADVLVEGERVVAPGHGQGWAEAAGRFIDATGRYVIPGGVDAHTHMELPFGGTNGA